MEKDAQFTVRLPAELKQRMQEAARAEDIDTMTWLRHAIREKLDRVDKVSNQELESIIRKTILDMKEKKII